MPIQIRGELLLAGHAPASIWEVRFHFCASGGSTSNSKD